MVSKYEDEHDRFFAINIKLLAALAFLPIFEVEEGFLDLTDIAGFMLEPQQLRFREYFEDTWLGRPQARGPRLSARYPIKLWNCHDAVVKDTARTNNAVEAWHRAFENLINAHHPNLWKFIRAIQKQFVLTEVRINQAIAGII